ncbi:hypothetical protein [Streptomyces sp. NPDC001880]
MPRPPVAAGPAQPHGECHQSLLHTVVEISFDAPAFRVDRPEHPGPAVRQFGDPLLQQLPLRGPEMIACQPGVDCVQREEPLEVEEEQHPAECRLGQQTQPVAGVAGEADGQQPGQYRPDPPPCGFP